MPMRWTPFLGVGREAVVNIVTCCLLRCKAYVATNTKKSAHRIRGRIRGRSPAGILLLPTNICDHIRVLPFRGVPIKQ